MEDILLVEILDSKYQEARDRFTNGEHTHEDLTVMMLKHQTNHIEHLEKDLRGEIKDLGARITSESNRTITIIGIIIAVAAIVVTIIPPLFKL